MSHENTRSSTRRHALKAGALATGTVLVPGVVGRVAAKPGKGNGKGNGKDEQCDIVVPDDYATIQEAVDEADEGETVCVRPGTYEEEVAIGTPVHLKGRTDPGSGNPATVDGHISVDAADVTVRRLRITKSETYQGGSFPDPFGVRVKAGGVVVENNLIEDISGDLTNGEGSFAINGVQVFGEGSNVEDVTVRDNVIRGFTSEGSEKWPKYGGIAGVKLQADVENVTVEENEITDHHSAGWVWGVVLTASGSADGNPAAVTVKRNDISGLNDGSVYDVFDGGNDGRNAAPFPGSAFGIDGGGDASEATVEQNNLLAPNGAESKDQDNTLVATCNWWGEKSGPTDDDNPDGSGTWALEQGAASIDYTPWLNAPAPSNACIGGADKGNGKGK